MKHSFVTRVLRFLSQECQMSMEKLYIWIYVLSFSSRILLNLRFIHNNIFHPANRINTIIGLQGISQLKRLTLHYMNNDQRRTKQEKVETKIFSETPAMCGMSASKDLADAKSTKI